MTRLARNSVHVRRVKRDLSLSDQALLERVNPVSVAGSPDRSVFIFTHDDCQAVLLAALHADTNNYRSSKNSIESTQL